jgi:hypothetical protein
MRGVKAALGVSILGGVLFAATAALRAGMPIGGSVKLFATLRR